MKNVILYREKKICRRICLPNPQKYDYYYCKLHFKSDINIYLKDLPFNMCTLTDVGLALDGSHVYTPESL